MGMLCHFLVRGKLRKLSMSNHLRTQKYQVTECRDTGITGKKVDGMKLEGTVGKKKKA